MLLSFSELLFCCLTIDEDGATYGNDEGEELANNGYRIHSNIKGTSLHTEIIYAR